MTLVFLFKIKSLFYYFFFVSKTTLNYFGYIFISGLFKKRLN